MFDGSSFDLLSAIQDYLATAKVNISMREVVEALVVTPVIVVVDERRDGPFQITWGMLNLAHERAEALRLARAATGLGRDDAIALAAAGFALIMFGEAVDGDAFLDRALELDPNLAWAWHISGFSKALVGQLDVVVERASHAMRLSPQDPQSFAMHNIVALSHFFTGRYDEAFAGAEAALREKPNFLLAAGMAAASAALSGRHADADKAMALLLKINPGLRDSNLNELLTFQRTEEIELWTDGLRKAGLPE